MMEQELYQPGDTNLEDAFDALFAEPEEQQDTNAAEPDSAQDSGEAAPAGREAAEASGRVQQGDGSPEQESQTAGGKPDGDGGSAKEPPEPVYTVSFLGEQRELPVSELITAAQKGLNYDHVKSEREALREQSGAYQNAYAVMEQMAQASGMTLDEYAAFCGKTLEENRLREQLDRGVPEDVAKRLLELEQNESRRAGEEQQRQQQEAQRAQYAELLREYPDLKELPDEVAASIAGGERPLAAYRAYELRQLKSELSALKKAEENKRKSTGSLQGDAPEVVDDFLFGFNSI